MPMVSGDESRIREATLTALLGGGLTGSVMGGLGGLFDSHGGSGKALKRKAMIGALAGGAAGAGIAGGSTFLGNKILGAPEEDDPTGFTTRGAVGGAVGGGIGGAGLGALAAREKIPFPKKSPEFLRAYASKLKAMPLSKGAGIGAAVGALGLGSLASYLGADEGMQLDFINNQVKAEKMKKMRSDYGY